MRKLKATEKFKNLTFRQKIGYVRDYYTVHIIALAFALAALGWGLNHYIFNPPPRTFVNVSFYGRHIPEELRSLIASDLTQVLVQGDVNYAVITDNFFTSGNMQFDMAMSQRMMAMITAREIDILIVSPSEVYAYFDIGLALDLSEILSGDILAQLSDAIVTGQDHEGNAGVMGLLIENSPYFSNMEWDFGGNFNGWTLIVLSNAHRDDAIRAFINHTLLSY